jgi:uroporphyrinogen-III decarboxylase
MTTTGLERALAYLNMEKTDKIPIWHQSSDISRKLVGATFPEFAFDAKKIAAGHIGYVRKYKPDISGVNTDMWWMLEPMGAQIEILDHIIQPKPSPNKDRPDPEIYDRLEYRSPFEGPRAKVVLEGMKMVFDKVGNEVLLRHGYYGPAGNLAVLFGIPEVMRDAVLFPDVMMRAVKRVMLPWTVDFITGMCEAVKPNLHNICWAMTPFDYDLMPRELWDRIAEVELEAFLKIRDNVGKDLPVTTHFCGNRPALDFAMERFGKYINELQFWWPGSDYALETAVRKYGNRKPLMAGIDHTRTMITGSPADVDRMVKQAIEIADERCSFALGPGCDMAYITPDENLYALVEARDKYGTHPLGHARG